MHLTDDQLVDYAYRDWVAQTADLDYFSFARHCQLSERDTNAHYGSILNTLLKSPDHQVVKLAKQAQKTFQQRKGKGSNEMSAFFVKYTQFWGKGDEHRDDQQQGASSSEAFSRLNKRQFDAVNDLNDIMCSTIVDNAKKLKMSMDEAAELVSTLPKPNSSSIMVNDILDWDKATKMILKETSCYKGIKKRLALEPAIRSSVFIQYIEQIVACSPTQHNLQVAIRTSPVSPADYDCYAHADFRIAEKLMHHFLDLIQAPVKILHERSLERTAACSTTIFLINTLFLSCNDTLKLKWIEVSVEPSGSVKWDGLGLAVDDGCSGAVPMVAEFAGGIRTHTKLKKNSDHAKLLLHAKDMVDANSKYSSAHCGKVFCILYHEMSITLDILVNAEDKYVRKNIMEFKLPTTELELKEFAAKLELLLQWRDTVISNVKSLQS
ncbi:hypothetical protein O0I10_013123 [Lichtheimia ornata]|uniref:Uncharacterized protein n=1 Tax=Lichtheimia ornata TaxID=688661 RepID=A0AAD7UQV9_9FUNG|nr:uncharacterized protein O0I10_013123 [Lichtheimia ornata]KAJ8651361.1 hypothetical protein O0I10_013123 [Lichtheimia ornata]